MTSKKRIELGYSDFEQFIKANNYFVDKSMLIYDLFEQGAYISLMPRPKRFGKTLNLSMIEHFFDINKSGSASLFTEYQITEKKDFCKEHQNRYPVINISLKDINETNWNDCFEMLKYTISKLYKKHDYLLNSDKISSYEKQIFEQIISKKGTGADYKFSLLNLSEYLNNHFGERVIILVDEYDAPIINAYQNTPVPIKSEKGNATYYENVINFMQTFLGKVFKGNDTNIKKGLLTGVMRVGKESIFSKWNNFRVYGITSPYFDTYFGFLENEIEKILTYFDLQKRAANIKKWYDGYKFGNTEKIYNPWSIANYICYEKEGFKPYWVNSGDYSLIKERIFELETKNIIQDLIEGKIIEKELKENFVFSDFETNNDLLWTLLTDNGYLTQIEKSKYGNYKLKIPNKEVRIVFTDIIRMWLNTEVKIKRDLLIDTAEDLINNRISDFETGFKKIVGDTLSYFDTARKSSGETTIDTEQIYHVYTLGLLAILADDYIIKSNRESKHGRYDILLIPHEKQQNGIVIEIKQTKKQSINEEKEYFKKRINKSIDEALKQIEINQYHTELITNKIKPENIIKLPIVFAGKEPYILKL